MTRCSRYLRLGLGGVLGLATSLVSCRHRAEPTKSEMSEPQLVEHLERAAKFLVELDVARARTELDAIRARRFEVDLMRARLALAMGDCQGAVTLLASYASEVVESGGANASASGTLTPRADPREAGLSAELYSVANGCAHAMAGATILNDEQRGVWVRFQNPHDHVLMPLIAEVADRAAVAIGKHLGTALPRPLRIELVADLASLASVTGLPLPAAETTGTIAIARWGKVTIVSPRATPDGYPWQDTLAHELTHLMVSRRSDDSAPLWLQEGIAKREETRWRRRTPLDERDDSHREARQALSEGRSVGVDRLGASIALLPTPKAAETAYAEVRDFLDYWVDNNGEPALIMLLHDLSGLRGDKVERAMMSVSGYTVNQWILRWQHALMDESRRIATSPVQAESAGQTEAQWDVDMARRLRLAELFVQHHAAAAVSAQLAPFATLTRMPPELLTQLALSEVWLGRIDAARRFVAPTLLHHLDGRWLALRGRVLVAAGDLLAAEEAFQLSLAFAPTLDNVACRGFLSGELDASATPAALPVTEPWASLCRAALDLGH